MESFTSTWVCITTRRWCPQKSRVSSMCVWCNGTYDFLAQIRVLLTKPRMMRSAYDRPVKQSEALCWMHCVYWPLEIIVDEEWEVTTECPLISSSLRCFAVIPQWCWKMKYVAAPHFLIKWCSLGWGGLSQRSLWRSIFNTCTTQIKLYPACTDLLWRFLVLHWMCITATSCD